MPDIKKEIIMTVLETKTRETRDSWGHKGVATYERLTEWNDHGWATVRVSDTSTGHGWQGQMQKDAW
jgi:hypothetical protein